MNRCDCGALILGKATRCHICAVKRQKTLQAKSLAGELANRRIEGKGAVAEACAVATLRYWAPSDEGFGE